MDRKKSILIIVAIVIGFVMLRTFRANASESHQTYAVRKEDITESIEVSGNVQSAAESPVTTTTTGIIEELYAENGDLVVQGQNLFKVRSTATEQEKAAAFANYMQAKTAMGNVKATQYSYQSDMFQKWKDYKETAESSQYENDDGTPKENERTLPEFHSSKDDWLAAEALYKNQDVAIAQAQAALNSTWLAYQATLDSLITAPMAGTVINLTNSLGDKVIAGTSLTSGVPILTIANLENLTIKIQINEGDIAKLSVGQKADIQLDAIKDKMFTGKILRLDTKGTSNQGVVTYNGYVTLDTIDPDIKPMMTATVRVIAKKREHVLTVPNNAIVTNEGQKSVKVINEKGKTDIVPVKLGVKGLTKTEIVGGLSEGQQVVTESK